MIEIKNGNVSVIGTKMEVINELSCICEALMKNGYKAEEIWSGVGIGTMSAYRQEGEKE